MVERALLEEGREERGTAWGSEAEGKDGEGREERDVVMERQSCEGTVSTLRWWVMKVVGELGARWRGLNFDFDGELLERNLALLVEEEVFFRPFEKANGLEGPGCCNMSQQGDDGREGGLADNRRRLAHEGEEDTMVVYLFRR